MLNITRKAVTFGLAAIFALGLAGMASAETQGQKDHPRRTQVNGRLKNQNRRIHHKVKDRQITKAKAASLHHDDHQIHQEGRDMASQDGGHVTKQEDHTLNQQENGVSHQIGQ